MQKVYLSLNHDDFFCPVTGQQILSEFDLKVTPSLKFFYVDTGFILHASDDILKVLALNDYDISNESVEININEAEELIKDMKSLKNCILFMVTTGGPGPVSGAYGICIDMNAKEVKKI
jgi:hypothetical protein